MTAPAENPRECALGFEAKHRLFIVECFEHEATGPVVFTAFDADDALPDRGQRQVRAKFLRDSISQAKALKACASQKNRVKLAFFESPQARVDIAAQQFGLQVWPGAAQLGLPART
jgi:hypothetical protein